MLIDVVTWRTYLFRWCWACLPRQRLLQFDSSGMHLVAFRDFFSWCCTFLRINLARNTLGVQLNRMLVPAGNHFWSERSPSVSTTSIKYKWYTELSRYTKLLLQQKTFSTLNNKWALCDRHEILKRNLSSSIIKKWQFNFQNGKNRFTLKQCVSEICKGKDHYSS